MIFYLLFTFEKIPEKKKKVRIIVIQTYICILNEAKKKKDNIIERIYYGK